MRILLTVPLLLTLHAAASAQPAHRLVDLPRDTYIDKVKGGWAGQMIGVSYGSAYEFNALGHIMETPIRDWEPEFVENSIHQDDLYVDMTFLQAIEQYGLDCTHEQAGRVFGESGYPLWHANHAGRENVRNGIMPPLSGHPAHNSHFDDIDFQIEADGLGLIAPGMPQASNALCDVFGHVMNYGDGVYGGMWVAAMYAIAYFEDDVETVVRRGLEAIPAESTYAACIRDVLECYEADPDDWRACWHVIEDRWGDVDICGRDVPFNIDAKLNGAYIAIGLLYGHGDLERTMEISCRCGQDQDCNPANAAGVLGTMLGYEGIPERFRRNIPFIADIPFSHTPYSFNSLAELCAGMAAEIIEREGGDSRGDVWRVPLQRPVPPESLEQYIIADTYVKLRAESGVDGVVLTWREAPSARAYALRRRAPGGVWRTVGRVAPGVGRYVDTTLAVGEAREYSLRVDLAVDGEPRTAAVRGFRLDPNAGNEPSDMNLALLPDAWAEAAVMAPLGSGLEDIEVIRNGVLEENYDSFDGVNEAEVDWYAIRFARAVNASRVVYTEGRNFDNGGWWLSLGLEALDPATMEWRAVDGLSISPEYDFEDSQEGRVGTTRFELTFAPTKCAGLRLIGRPGGTAQFTSIAELEVYYPPTAR